MNIQNIDQSIFAMVNKNRSKKISRQNQKGQALIEYIILLVLVVGVTVGLMREVSNTMKSKLTETKERINKYVP